MGNDNKEVNSTAQMDKEGTNNIFYSTFIMCMDCSTIWISNL